MGAILRKPSRPFYLGALATVSLGVGALAAAAVALRAHKRELSNNNSNSSSEPELRGKPVEEPSEPEEPCFAAALPGIIHELLQEAERRKQQQQQQQPQQKQQQQQQLLPTWLEQQLQSTEAKILENRVLDIGSFCKAELTWRGTRLQPCFELGKWLHDLGNSNNNKNKNKKNNNSNNNNHSNSNNNNNNNSSNTNSSCEPDRAPASPEVLNLSSLRLNRLLADDGRQAELAAMLEALHEPCWDEWAEREAADEEASRIIDEAHGCW
ncbi:unnamed protein product [Polarella glacialis]|uniref:Uncharacterized protein n=1 Tax=Polarella glacialis TaxID=89957 RepID=A0A813JQE2_POLGL|nr:unnamed protein product [Polarella glacialis]